MKSLAECNSGVCVDLINEYRCDCFSGYIGENCENEIDECREWLLTNYQH